MARAAAGDNEAFGDLVRRHQSVVYRFLARRAGPLDAATSWPNGTSGSHRNRPRNAGCGSGWTRFRGSLPAYHTEHGVERRHGLERR